MPAIFLDTNHQICKSKENHRLVTIEPQRDINSFYLKENAKLRYGRVNATIIENNGVICANFENILLSMYYQKMYYKYKTYN